VPRAARRRGRTRAQPGAERNGLRELQELIDLAGDGDEPARVQRVQPAQATKRYICPGCQQEVPTGTAHLAVVPMAAPDLRRHWHTSCWLMRERRRPGR
jgi:hypothetical protein